MGVAQEARDHSYFRTSSVVNKVHPETSKPTRRLVKSTHNATENTRPLFVYSYLLDFSDDFMATQAEVSLVNV